MKRSFCSHRGRLISLILLSLSKQASLNGNSDSDSEAVECKRVLRYFQSLVGHQYWVWCRQLENPSTGSEAVQSERRLK